MSEKTPNPEGAVSESEDYVSGPGGPTMTQGGAMPGGPEMQGWKRPAVDNLPEPEESLEEQAENVRKLADS